LICIGNALHRLSDDKVVLHRYGSTANEPIRLSHSRGAEHDLVSQPVATNRGGWQTAIRTYSQTAPRKRVSNRYGRVRYAHVAQ